MNGECASFAAAARSRLAPVYRSSMFLGPRPRQSRAASAPLAIAQRNRHGRLLGLPETYFDLRDISRGSGIIPFVVARSVIITLFVVRFELV